jgi:hypothetical protein
MRLNATMIFDGVADHPPIETVILYDHPEAATQ